MNKSKFKNGASLYNMNEPKYLIIVAFLTILSYPHISTANCLNILNCETPAGEKIIFSNEVKIAYRELLVNQEPLVIVHMLGYVPMKGSVGLYTLGEKLIFKCRGTARLGSGLVFDHRKKRCYRFVAYQGKTYRDYLEEGIYLDADNINKYLEEKWVSKDVQEELRIIKAKQNERGKKYLTDDLVALSPNIALLKMMSQGLKGYGYVTYKGHNKIEVLTKESLQSIASKNLRELRMPDWNIVYYKGDMRVDVQVGSKGREMIRGMLKRRNNPNSGSGIERYWKKSK